MTPIPPTKEPSVDVAHAVRSGSDHARSGTPLTRAKRCYPCRIDLSPRMMAFHVELAHLVLRCQLRAAVIQRLGISRNRLRRH